ncbi:LCP family protein [Clostridium sp.]|uniref:LCP family protein n=1 Tax=Clostridium sp. TaxID=1506 RepID=UPI00321745BB
MANKNVTSNQSIKKRRMIKIILICSVVLVMLISSVFLFTNNLLSKIKRVELDNTDLGIREDVTEKIEMDEITNIVNIAILGVDETGNDVGRSDAMMIATFDPVHKKLKITSVMRDTYVEISGYGKDKLNHSFAYGGPQLTIKTLNQNFGLNITDYVKINFEELEGLIDAIGGIDMELSDEEIKELDDYIELVSTAYKIPVNFLVKDESEKVHLDGFQTLGYCRIRSTANGDFDRTERHRKIMTEMFNKISSAGTAKLTSMAAKLLPYVETSLSNKEIINLGANVLNLGTANIEQERFPRDEYSHNSEIWTPSVGLNIFYLCYDEAYTEKQMHEYIFNDRKLWLEDNQKVYIHDNEHYHENSEPKMTVPTTNNNNTNNNTNNTNNNNNTKDENTKNNDTSGDNTQDDNTGNGTGEDNTQTPSTGEDTNGDVETPNPSVPKPPNP